LAEELMPAEAETKGLLALMLLTDARRPARLSSSGELVPLEDQDRTLWNQGQVDEGIRILDDALCLRAPGPYQIQAAVAALHAEAATSPDTDWRQIALLYESLLRWNPTPIVELNAAVALGMATSIERALTSIAKIEEGGMLAGYYLLYASKADLLRRLGNRESASEAYSQALALATNPAERSYLAKRISECTSAEQ
jgi:RNA polymerase sigma-70 factor (ECF subfamily)